VIRERYQMRRGRPETDYDEQMFAVQEIVHGEHLHLRKSTAGRQDGGHGERRTWNEERKSTVRQRGRGANRGETKNFGL